ncbi:MAG: hypothetical protein ACRCTU_15775 [Zoogloea sp.]|uniref:hypothetical protein n=1 Tax=Zoogloea sp. TaxID=49181 RepID=UPI003F385CE7
MRNASLRDQASLCADLATLPQVCRQQGIEPPGLIVVGDVVRLADKLNWFDSYRAAIAESMTKVLPEMASPGKA